MNLFLAVTIGVLFAAGTYMMLRPNLIRIVLGMGLYSNAVNLLMIACGGYASDRAAPFVDGEGNTEATKLMDPLPPDIILTAIVISFAVGALFLTVCYRVYLDHGTDNPEELPNHEDPDEGPGSDDGHDAEQDETKDATSDTQEDGDTQDDDKDNGVPNVIAELSQPNPDSPREIVPDQKQEQIKDTNE